MKTGIVASGRLLERSSLTPRTYLSPTALVDDEIAWRREKIRKHDRVIRALKKQRSAILARFSDVVEKPMSKPIGMPKG